MLAAIRLQLTDRLHALKALARVVAVARVVPDPLSEDIIEVRPNIAGVGINLNALWRRLRARFGPANRQ